MEVVLFVVDKDVQNHSTDERHGHLKCEFCDIKAAFWDDGGVVPADVHSREEPSIRIRETKKCLRCFDDLIKSV